MGQIAELVTTCGRRARRIGDSLAAGIPAGRFARKPMLGGQVIETNHPAFNYGHLALYPSGILRFFGLDPARAAVPDGWAPLFQPGTPCRDDPDGRIYPSMAEILDVYRRAYDTALEAVGVLPDEAFAAPMPDERYRSFLPTVGTAALSMLNNHAMFHLGQVSTWRRCMGLGAAPL